MSNIEQIIPAEVVNDDFSLVLKEIGKIYALKNYLEIGSSSGGGSTGALVDGIKQRSDLDQVRLFCMELSRPRFNLLCEAYKNQEFVKTYNLSSIPLNKFPTEEEISFFYHNTHTNLNNYSLETIIDWYKQDLNYIDKNCLNFDGISFIKKANKITDFDFVLIDGSEFTGERELIQVIGAKIIALDDVNSFKCFSAYKILQSHFGYEIVTQNLDLRNGYAVFKKKF